MLRAAGRGDMATAKHHARGVIQYQAQNTDTCAGKSMVTCASLVMNDLKLPTQYFNHAEKTYAQGTYAQGQLRGLLISIERYQ